MAKCGEPLPGATMGDLACTKGEGHLYGHEVKVADLTYSWGDVGLLKPSSRQDSEKIAKADPAWRLTK